MNWGWGLRITYVDSANNQFLTLGEVRFRSKRERDDNRRRIPVSSKETDFILDILSARGIEDDAFVTESIVAQLIRVPTQALIKTAREFEERFQTQERGE